MVSLLASSLGIYGKQIGSRDTSLERATKTLALASSSRFAHAWHLETSPSGELARRLTNGERCKLFKLTLISPARQLYALENATVEGKEVQEEDYENDDDPTRYLKIFFHLAAIIPFLRLYILRKQPTFCDTTSGLPAK